MAVNLSKPMFDAVGQLSLQQVRSYLEGAGWLQRKRLGNRAEVWTGSGPGGGAEVLLSAQIDASDLQRASARRF